MLAAFAPDIEHAPLPHVPMEHVDCACGVLERRKEDGAAAAAASVGQQVHVCAEDGACAAEEVLDVLPASAEWEIVDDELCALVARGE